MSGLPLQLEPNTQYLHTLQSWVYSICLTKGKKKTQTKTNTLSKQNFAHYTFTHPVILWTVAK